MASRQEGQIVQSQLNLDDFLPGFTPSWRHLISVRSVVQVHPGPKGLTGFRGGDSGKLFLLTSARDKVPRGSRRCWRRRY